MTATPATKVSDPEGDLSSSGGATCVLVTFVVPYGWAGQSVQVHFDEVSLTPLVGMTIPASASAQGHNGPFYRKDLSLFCR